MRKKMMWSATENATAETGIVKGQEVEIKEEADPEIGSVEAGAKAEEIEEVNAGLETGRTDAPRAAAVPVTVVTDAPHANPAPVTGHASVVLRPVWDHHLVAGDVGVLAIVAVQYRHSAIPAT
jgi:hypothetical protein